MEACGWGPGWPVCVVEIGEVPSQPFGVLSAQSVSMLVRSVGGGGLTRPPSDMGPRIGSMFFCPPAFPATRQLENELLFPMRLTPSIPRGLSAASRWSCPEWSYHQSVGSRSSKRNMNLLGALAGRFRPRIRSRLKMRGSGCQRPIPGPRGSFSPVISRVVGICVDLPSDVVAVEPCRPSACCPALDV